MIVQRYVFCFLNFGVVLNSTSVFTFVTDVLSTCLFLQCIFRFHSSAMKRRIPLHQRLMHFSFQGKTLELCLYVQLKGKSQLIQRMVHPHCRRTVSVLFTFIGLFICRPGVSFLNGINRLSIVRIAFLFLLYMTPIVSLR